MRYQGSRGLGATTSQIAASATSTGLITAGGIIAAIPGLQLPGAIVAAVGAIAGPIISLFKGCGQTCVLATQYADQAGAAMKQMSDIYWNASPRTKSVQQYVLAQMGQIIQALQQACSNPALGAAGQRCISERLVRGGSAPWCPTGTGCDYYTSIVDPIANDPNVIDDSLPAQAGGLLQSVTSGSVAPWALAGLVLLGLWMAS